MMNFKGKVVFITGSTRGIGKSLAMGFAKEGADVIVHGRDLEKARGGCQRDRRDREEDRWLLPGMFPHPRM